MNEIHPYPRLARLALERRLAGQEAEISLPHQVSADESLWSLRAACFVSIKADKALRGCIGTISPVQANLGLEIMANAISAGVRDPRFPPVRPAELERLTFSVDVLSPPEPIAGPDQLDPLVWGVIVEKDGRRGVLLPNIEGVDTVDRQLAIAAAKAGLSGLEGVRLERFTVDRFLENA